MTLSKGIGTDCNARIAVCQNVHGEGMYVPLDPDEPAPTSCFMECDCTPRVYVAQDAAITDEMVRAFGQVLHDYGYDVAACTRVSPTEVRYEQGGATPAFETVRVALAAALGQPGEPRDA